MSGIFGFTYRTAEHSVLTDAIGGLEYWNRIYGDADQASEEFGSSAIGCYVEHFSDRFPHGGPILRMNGAPAVVDALLYNRDELLPLLDMPTDSMISDEELLLKLINEKGFAALREVNGDFAGAIFDEQKQQWTLFRDHLGVRPLFYYMDQDLIVFSTDLRGVVSVPGVDTSINGQYLFEYIQSIDFLSQTQTEFQHIHCVHPGSITQLTLGADSISQKLYWRVRERKIRLGSDEEYIRTMRELVTDAVHRRCDAIPGLLGAELSGGLDSCTIDIILNRHGRDAVYYSWCFSPERHALVQGDDERKVIQDVCEQENITCRFIEPEDNIFFSDQIKAHVPPYYNTPQLISGSKWMHEQGARVVFSGHGGDEGVSHRATPFELLCNLELRAYFRIHLMYMEGKKLRYLRALKSGIQEACQKIPPNFFRAKEEDLWLDVFDDDFVKRVLPVSKLTQTPFRYAPYRYVHRGGSRFRLDTCAFAGAYSGVRYLFPYIDYRVMDYAVSIPRRLHVDHQYNRLIFRRAFAQILPKSLFELRYKDIASFRNTSHVTYHYDQVRRNLTNILMYLDEDAWSGILDFDGIRKLRDADYSADENYPMHCVFVSRLSRLILIQETKKNAPRWRELDGQSV